MTNMISKIGLGLFCGTVLALAANAATYADGLPRVWVYTGKGISQVSQPVSRMCFFRPMTGEELCFERGERVEASICVDTSGIIGFPDAEYCGPDQRLGDAVVQPFEPLPELP